MPVFIASLNSGSNGNCYYLGNEDEAILVDVGISCKEIERRMHRLGLDINKLRAIFISHEHTDHTVGLAVMANKYRLPVYITALTYRNAGLRLSSELVESFNTELPIIIGNLSVKAFQKQHDACDPHSFIVRSSSGVCVGVFTDIGNPCKELEYHFKQCHAAFLESNYDEVMLMNGKYPYFLKNRIRGGLGHLSNTQALELFLAHRSSFMSHLLLSHLSKENNCPRLVGNLFRSHATNTNIIVTSRCQETPVFEIKEDSKSVHVGSFYAQRQLQLSLF